MDNKIYSEEFGIILFAVYPYVCAQPKMVGTEVIQVASPIFITKILRHLIGKENRRVWKKVFQEKVFQENENN